MGGKELKGGSQALSIFSTLTKELQNGLNTISGAIFDMLLLSGIRATYCLPESRGLQREDGSAG